MTTMDEAGKAAIVHASSARALLRAMGMNAANQAAAAAGEPPVYGEAAFSELVDDEGIGWNAVMEVLRG